MTISDDVWTQIWQTALIVVVGVVVWLLARRLIHRSSARLQSRLVATGDLVDRAKAERLHTIERTLSTLVFIGAATVAVVTILGVWGVPLGPLIASLSVVGLAIGIGAQDLVKDVIAGIFVLVEDQYAVGDVVELAGVSGTVDEIRLRTTVLQDLDGSIHHVPNGAVRVSTNLTYEYSRVVVDLSVAYEESVDQALDAIGDVAAQLAGDAEWSASIIDDPQVLGVDALDDSGVVIRVLFTTDPEMRWKVKREFLRRVKNGLDEAGIEIPYPHVTLTHRPDSG